MGQKYGAIEIILTVGTLPEVGCVPSLGHSVQWVKRYGAIYSSQKPFKPAYTAKY